MNAHTLPISIPRVMRNPDPLKAQARRLYAAMIPEVAGTARIPSPVSYPDEAQDVINRHALKLALALVGIAAERMNVDRFYRDYAAQVAVLAEALIEGQDWSLVHARSERDDHWRMVEANAEKLRDAAENIASKEWGA